MEVHEDKALLDPSSSMVAIYRGIKEQDGKWTFFLPIAMGHEHFYFCGRWQGKDNFNQRRSLDHITVLGNLCLLCNFPMKNN